MWIKCNIESNDGSPAHPSLVNLDQITLISLDKRTETVEFGLGAEMYETKDPKVFELCTQYLSPVDTDDI